MFAVGSLLTIAGILSVVFSLNMDVSVYTSPSFTGTDFVGGGNVINLQKLQQQMMLFQGGLVATLAGILVLCAASLAEAFGSRVQGNGKSEEIAKSPAIAELV